MRCTAVTANLEVNSVSALTFTVNFDDAQFTASKRSFTMYIDNAAYYIQSGAKCKNTCSGTTSEVSCVTNTDNVGFPACQLTASITKYEFTISNFKLPINTKSIIFRFTDVDSNECYATLMPNPRSKISGSIASETDKMTGSDGYIEFTYTPPYTMHGVQITLSILIADLDRKVTVAGTEVFSLYSTGKVVIVQGDTTAVSRTYHISGITYPITTVDQRVTVSVRCDEGTGLALVESESLTYKASKYNIITFNEDIYVTDPGTCVPSKYTFKMNAPISLSEAVLIFTPTAGTVLKLKDGADTTISSANVPANVCSALPTYVVSNKLVIDGRANCEVSLKGDVLIEVNQIMNQNSTGTGFKFTPDIRCPDASLTHLAAMNDDTTKCMEGSERALSQDFVPSIFH